MDKSKITQKKIAELAGVSRSMVSLVINNSSKPIHPETRRRILDIVQEYSYKVNPLALQLRSGQSRFVNIIATRMSGYQMQMMLNCLMWELSQAGLISIITSIDPDIPENISPAAINLDFAGTLVLDHVFCGYDFFPAAHIEKHISHSEHVVYLNKPIDKDDFTSIKIDYGNGVREAIHALYAKGKRNFGLAVNHLKNEPQMGRLNGFRAGLQEVGLPFRPEMVWDAVEHGLGFAADSNSIAAQTEMIYDNLVVKQKADALILNNDFWAVRQINHLHAHGIQVPEDIAIIGYEDAVPLCLSSAPELSSICMDIPETARIMVATLLADIRGEKAPACEVVQTRFIERGSA